MAPANTNESEKEAAADDKKWQIYDSSVNVKLL